MQLSTLFAKQIVSPAGDELGCILGVYLTKNQKSVARLLCVDREDECFCLPARAIREIGDVVVAEDLKDDSDTGVPCPLGRTVFSDTGKRLGYLKDVILADEGAIVVDGDTETRYPLSRVKLGDAVIVKSERAKAPKAPRQKSDSKVAPPDVPEESQNDGGMYDKTAVETAARKNGTPESHAGVNRINLLGRRVRIDLLDSDGEVVVSAGEIITPQILQRARRSNRLLMLTVCTLTNLVI